MKQPTDQANCEMLAEKVMGWKATSFDFIKMVNGDPNNVEWVGSTIADSWNPFANPSDAVSLMEALPEKIELWSKRRNGQYGFHLREQLGPDPSVSSMLILEVSGTDFARTLTTAICRLVRERPELFEGNDVTK